MEVNEGNINEAIIYLGKIKDVLWPNISNAKYKVYEEKIINIMALLNELRKLKSLASENKKLKKENKALRKDKWELEGINEACRKENEAYEGMWKELKPTDDYECLILEERHLLSKMGNLENKYLGGGE